MTRPPSTAPKPPQPDRANKPVTRAKRGRESGVCAAQDSPETVAERVAEFDRDFPVPMDVFLASVPF